MPTAQARSFALELPRVTVPTRVPRRGWRAGQRTARPETGWAAERVWPAHRSSPVQQTWTP